jgi:hypothetical protein
MVRIGIEASERIGLACEAEAVVGLQSCQCYLNVANDPNQSLLAGDEQTNSIVELIRAFFGRCGHGCEQTWTVLRNDATSFRNVSILGFGRFGCSL